MNKIPVVDSMGNKIGNFTPTGNGCGFGAIGLVSLLLFSWAYVFTDVAKRPKVWAETAAEAVKKYWILELLLFANIVTFFVSIVAIGMVSISNMVGNYDLGIFGAFGFLGAIASGFVGAILFLTLELLFFNDVRKKE